MDDTKLPQEWKHDEERPDANVKRFLADLPNKAKHWDEHGVSSARLPIDPVRGKGQLQPRHYFSLEAAAQYGIDPKTEYIYVTRETPAGQEPTVYKSANGKRKGFDFATMPIDELDSAKKQGFEVYPAEDVTEPDQPVESADRYLDRGIKLVEEHMTQDSNWRYGQLIGPNGSDPATMNDSPSYTTWENYNANRKNPNRELRSATSTGHIPITPDMVKDEKTDCCKDPLGPLTFIDGGTGEEDTIDRYLEYSDLAPPAHELSSLKEVVDGREKPKKQRLPPEREAPFAGVPGHNP